MLSSCVAGLSWHYNIFQCCCVVELCCRSLLLAVACLHCQRKKLSFSCGLSAAEVGSTEADKHCCKNFGFRKWNLEERKNCAVGYRYFDGRTWNRKVPPLSFAAINILDIVSEHCGCLSWNQGSSEQWVEAGCDQRSSQTAHPTLILFLGVNRFVGRVFLIYVEKV